MKKAVNLQLFFSDSQILTYIFSCIEEKIEVEILKKNT